MGQHPELSEALELERARLLQEIEDLDAEHGAGEIDDQSYESLRDEHVASAAAVLRELEARGARADAPPPTAGAAELAPGGDAGPRAGALPDDVDDAVAPVALFSRGGMVAGLLGTVGVVVLCVVVVSAIGRGGGAQASAPASQPGTARAVASDLYEARTLANKGQDVQALQLFDQVLLSQPRNAEALAYQGWLLRQAGLSSGNRTLVSSGRASIEEAVAADPTYPDAHAFLGYVLLQDDRNPAAAAGQFRLFLSEHPPAALVALTQGAVSEAFGAIGQPVPPASSPAGSGS